MIKGRDFDLRYITRMDYKRQRPHWIVRFYPDIPDHYIFNCFYDSEHGGKYEALIEAKAYRNWVECNWPMPELYTGYTFPIKGFHRSIRRDNKTGYTGVGFVKFDRVHGMVPYYFATWYENGKLKNKYFNAEKLGMEAAKKMAIKLRLDIERHLNENRG